jgi:penicillin-binding protein 2
VQSLADQKLEGQSAALVVMDVNNGDVIAMSSTPGFDPNLFNVGLSGPQWRDLTTDDHKPLLNKFMGGIYPPGSTFKTAVALAAIDAGIATPDYHVSCNGVFNFGGHAFHCWQHKGHGTLDVVGGIQHSCDVFFYETARRVGIDKIEESARKLGLGALTGIELPGEHSGLVPSREWKHAQCRHRAGLCHRHAAAALPTSSAYRQRQAGLAPHGSFGRRAGAAAPRIRQTGFLRRCAGEGAAGHEQGDE